MGRLILATLVIGIALLGACVSSPEPKPFPPPEGYENWEVYHEEYQGQADSPQSIPATFPSSEPPLITKSYIYIDGGIVVRGNGEPIVLINNPDATNPTLAELVAFLEKDRTDEYPYIVGPPKNAFICSDFAETIHNNAEAAGIRAAWVGIDIEGEAEGHALNAFETTDLGLVFIDSTGKGLWDDPTTVVNWDRRACVEIGKLYAVAGMNSHASHFWFYIGAIPMRNSLKLTYPSVWELFKEHFTTRLEWDQTHDIKALGQEWMQEWLQKHKVELSECGRVNEPRWSSGKWNVYMLDCWDVPWFQPEQVIVKEEYIGGPNWRGFLEFQILYPDAKVEQKIIEVDGLSLAWEIGWEDMVRLEDEGLGWYKPFGNKAVNDIHIQWGE